MQDDDGGLSFEERDILVVPADEGNGGCGCRSAPGGSLLVLLLFMGIAARIRATS